VSLLAPSTQMETSGAKRGRPSHTSAGQLLREPPMVAGVATS